MTTTITTVDTERSIEHGVLIDLTLDGTTYYISNCYKSVQYPAGTGPVYLALAGFLTVSEIQSNLSNANDEIQVTLSAIPPEYISAVLGEPIKGGEINIYRAFFDYQTQEVIADEVYRRFTGVISNFSVQEDVDTINQEPDVTHTITIIASSIMGVLENKVSGRRTNRKDYQEYWSELYNKIITSITGTNTLTSVNHHLGIGQQLKYVGTTQLGLTANTTYYVLAPLTADNFRLSATYNGTPLTLTNGTGLSLQFQHVNAYIDGSMDRVETLFNSSFDFGKKYVPEQTGTVGNGGGGGGGGKPGGGGGQVPVHDM